MDAYVEKKPYLTDGVIGNSRMLATIGRTGRLYRLWWPHIDFPQHVDEIRCGLFMPGGSGRTAWFDSAAEGWEHEAGYTARTNVLRVRAKAARCPIAVEQLDFAVPGEDLLVRMFEFCNQGSETATFRFVYYCSLNISESPFYNAVQFVESHDALLHFRREYFFAVAGANVCTGFQCGRAWDNACRGELNGNRIDTAPDGALSWTFADVKPGESVRMAVYMAAGDTMESALAGLAEAKKRTPEQWLDRTERCWRDFLGGIPPCPLGPRQLAELSAGGRTPEPDALADEIAELYERSLLVAALMTDEKTGSIVAAPEVDERFSRCGGYAYCWGRDAAFIATALNKAGLTRMSSRFYDWALTAQDADGSWQQRHYHDGRLAPSWGLQIDEGASILWGIWEYFRTTGDQAFLERVWPAVAKGAAFLMSFIDPITGLPLPSRDLWEEREAEHTYSAAAVFGALSAAASVAETCGFGEAAAAWRTQAEQMRDSILRLCWNEERGVFYRGLHLTVSEERYRQAQNGAERGQTGRIDRLPKGYLKYVLPYDPVVDVSLLGLCVPFGVIPADHPYAVRTADTIERTLTVPGVGGLMRYEDDRYAGGNPWILTTLWLAHYRALRGQSSEALALLRWVVRHRTETGLLPEQVDKRTGEPAWVVPLTWSHAMFIIAVHLLADKAAMK